MADEELYWPAAPPAQLAPCLPRARQRPATSSKRSARSRQDVPAIIDKVLRAGEGKILRRLHRIAEQVNSIEEDYEALSDAELRALTEEFKQRLADGETLDDLLP